MLAYLTSTFMYLPSTDKQGHIMFYHKDIYKIMSVMIFLFSLSSVSFGRDTINSNLLPISNENINNVKMIIEIKTEVSDWVTSLAIDNNSEMIAVGLKNGHVLLFDIDDLSSPQILNAQEYSITALKFIDGTQSQDFLVSASLDGTIIVWQLPILEVFATLTNEFNFGILDISFDASSSLLAYSSSGGPFYQQSNAIGIWNWQAVSSTSIRIVENYTEQIPVVSYHPLRSLLIYGDALGRLIALDTRNYQNVATINAHDLWVYDLAFNSDGTRLASAGYDQTVKLWDTMTWEQLGSNANSSSTIATLTFDPSDSLLIFGDYEGVVRVVDVATMLEVKSFLAHHLPITALVISSNNRLIVTGSTDNTIKIWGIVQ